MSNSKNLTSKNKNPFLRNSRFDIFYEDKDMEKLLELVHPVDRESESSWSVLYSITTKLQRKISNLIPRLIRPVRLELKEEEVAAFSTFTKDFIELEPSTQKAYFATFADLLVFRLRLLDYKDQEDPDGNYDYLQKLKLSTELIERLHEVRRFGRTVTSEILEDHNQDSLFFIECQVVEIVMELLRTEIQFETVLEYTTFWNPVVLFFILQSTNPSDGSFKSEMVISKLASKMIYGSRLFLLGSIWTKEVQSLSATTSTFNVPEYYRSTLPLVTVSHGHNYFEEVARIRRYLLKVLKERVSENKTIIDIGPETYLVYQKQYSFHGLQQLHSRLQVQLRDLLFSRLVLLPRQDLPRIKIGELEDNSSISTEGYYLADNPSFIPIKTFMQQQLMTPSSSLYRSLIKKVESDGTRRWYHTKIADFLQGRQEFIKIFLLAAHLTSGSPLRGTEWEHTTYRNLRGTETNIRDVIWDQNQGQVRITTHWHKTRNITRKGQPNVRFLPPTLSYILVYYILYVMPVYYYLSIEYLEQDEISPFLFEINGSRILSPTLSRMLYIRSSQEFRHGLTLNPYRHLVNHIILEKIGPEAEAFLDASDENSDTPIDIVDSIVDIQANRSSKTAALNYSLLATQPVGGMRQKYLRTILFTQRYHALFKIDNLDPIFDYSLSTVVENEPALENDDLQLELIAHPKETLTPKIDIQYQLSRFFQDKNAKFRDDFQREAVRAMFESMTYLTYINRTGSGKSLLYLLPAFTQYNQVVNIVLTPRVTLRDDLLNRAKTRKIRSTRFEDISLEVQERHSYQPYSLVVTSIESTQNSAFSEYIVQLQQSHRPIRLYIDEVHTVILEQKFRWVMKYVNNLLRYKVPIVFISATLPVPLLRLVEQHFLLPPGTNRIIRSNTIRDDIDHRIVNLKARPNESDIQTLLEKLEVRGLGPKTKAIIFVSSTADGKSLSKSTGLPFYHAGDSEKDSTLRSFLSNDSILVILATSALSLGVDFDIIKFTVHLPPHWQGLVDFVQASSRIRRGGLSVIINIRRDEASKIKYRESYSAMDLSTITTVDEFKTVDRLVFDKILNEDQCVRQIMSHFLDNIDIVSCLSYNTTIASKITPCYICRRVQGTLDRQAEKEEATVMDSNIGLAEFEAQVESFGLHRCLVCLIFGEVKGVESHTFKQCPFARSERGYPIASALSQRTRSLNSRLAKGYGLTKGSCCYKCLLPSRVCSRLKDIENKEAIAECIYPQVVRQFIVISSVYLEREDDGQFLRHLGIESSDLRRTPSDPTGLEEYFRRPIQLFGTDAIMACRVLNELPVTKIIQAWEEKREESRLKRLRLSV
jgi:superfamily II DNA helicase RecQ